MKYSMILLALLTTFASAAEDAHKKEMDRKAILAMAGAYVVDFHFEETAGFLPGYELKDDQDSAGLEVVIVLANDENKIVLQHILQTSHGIVKHWRQDWEYENRILWEYQQDNLWIKRELNAAETAGTWTQRVFQVDDSPRYESLGRWVHRGNLSQWESAETHRPLPRREYSKRDDYQVLIARNRHALTPTGWVHEQDNYKLSLAENREQIIAREIGLNRYDHTNPDKLQEARDWWAANGATWAAVRDAWSDFFASHKQIHLAKTRDDKPLWKHMFSMTQEAAEEKISPEEVKQRATVLIEQFHEEAPQKTASINY